MTNQSKLTEHEALKIATHKHYKGGLYRYIATALHTETGEDTVVYEHVYPHEKALYVRPASMFYGDTEDGIKRFTPLENLPMATNPIPATYISEVTDATFEQEVLRAPGVTLIDFWAPWCGPCKMLMPSLERTAQAYFGRVKVVKMNIDENNEIPAKYGVRGIPNMMVFVGGIQVRNIVGAKSLSQLTEIFEQIVQG